MKFVEPIRDKGEIACVKRILKETCLRNYVLFVLGINSGLRISDVLGLDIEDVENKDYIEMVKKNRIV